MSAPPRRRALGIDGGGSRTRAALVDGSGRVLGRGESGPAHLCDAALESVRASLDAARREAWRAAGEEPRAADAAFLGVAGAGDATVRATLERIAVELELARPGAVRVDTDLRAALAGGLGGESEPGIVVVAGTGSACYGRAHGREARAGGWGSLADDAGSGYDLGRRAIAACLRAHDGRGEPTALTRRVLVALGASDWRELVGSLDARRDRRRVAQLAPLVLAAKAEGDAIAHAIVAAGADELALAAAAVACALELEAPRIVAAGGVLGDASYRTALAAALAARLPRAHLAEPREPADVGAARIALALAGS